MIREYLSYHFEKDPNDGLMLKKLTDEFGIAEFLVRDIKPSIFIRVGI